MEGIDRLSALPDSLLIHILSLLETKEAAVTAFLSKGWRYLWTESPNLIFRDNSWNFERTRMFVSMVNWTLANCNRNNLERFEVEFVYDYDFACDVDAWIEFAVKNKVKNVTLLLHHDDFSIHQLPQMMYSNSSLTMLQMQGVEIPPLRTIEWQSLTKLHLEQVNLSQDALDDILSSCHVLRYVHLIECTGFEYIRVDSRSICKLKVHESFTESDPILDIVAPYLLSLDIRVHASRLREFRVTDIPSLVSARFDFFSFQLINLVDDRKLLVSSMKEFFVNIKHVNELELGCECIMVLYYLRTYGWELPQSRRRCLKLQALSEFCSIDGILGLLESSPDLETFVIEFIDPKPRLGYFLFGVPKVVLDCDLLHLKTVSITNCSRSNPDFKLLMRLSCILLKRAVVLEKMVIDFKDTSSLSTADPGDYFKIAQKLLCYPRSSQNAVVTIRQ